MERKEKATILLGTVGLLGILLVSFLGIGSQPISALPQSSQSPESLLAPPMLIPGNTYTGKYIRIGLNKGGTFGVGPGGTSNGTGFQYPIGPQYESLAIWWWGEGYAVFYKTKVGTKWVDNYAYWWPELGWPINATISHLKWIYATEKRNDDNRAIYQVRVQTIDKALNLTFTFSFPKPQKYVLLQTQITNNGAKGTLRDVLYKRIVDWDIHWVTYNMWTSDAHAAYASYYNKTEGRTFEMSVSGYTPTGLTNEVSYVDLYAWDDMATRGPGFYDIQSHNAPLPGDGCAAIYYDLGGDMATRTTKTVMTVYQAGWNWLVPPA